MDEIEEQALIKEQKIALSERLVLGGRYLRRWPGIRILEVTNRPRTEILSQ